MTRSGGYRDRSHGGHALAAELSALAGRDDVVVLALPRGGVPVAAEVARALGAPLDAFVVRKLGVPGHEELAFGAVGLWYDDFDATTEDEARRILDAAASGRER